MQYWHGSLPKGDVDIDKILKITVSYYSNKNKQNIPHLVLEIQILANFRELLFFYVTILSKGSWLSPSSMSCFGVVQSFCAGVHILEFFESYCVFTYI